ncbi:EamA-like transporter family/Triose-phosphate Transporter family/UAA transporter family [Leishmania donovani]|uniref:EamA-like_transporter_family/Triose-phosphate_Tra nsporter_family/UAA_transporter_family_putative/Pfam:PF0089 2/Pfam:PF03151/Pfam:PF08449 n=1 Tax=Leishmania donovani TaxID=5661 RepID=A0A6J8F4V0_LEIDO|nr:EamA-like transporter family/Triose-phosphate Transporter family/UAA transporter family [Leishmania donovani]VDZ41610.1 EamA-like_transporter_family/Triose-phosphate_Transporter_family/UAA_transporter_family_putative/Pfam:PF00892/Pfam:PF03151/Pfam:PF08449 [Leishmania donovani]
MDRQRCVSPSASANSHETMLSQQPDGQRPSSSSCPPPPRQPTTQRLCALAAGVLVFHVLTSALQETIFHLPGFTNLLLLSCGETFCTTVLVGLLLVWGWYHQLPRRAASEHQGPHGRSAATAVGAGTAEASPHGPLSNPAHGVGGSSNKQGWCLGDAVGHSPGAVCAAGHLPHGQERSRPHGDGRGAPTSVAEAVPVAVAADRGKGSALTLGAAHDSPSTSGASWRSTIRRVFHPSTVATRWYVRIAVLLSCSLYLTNRTSFFLSYSLQVIFKSSKLLCMVVVHRWWMRDSPEAAAPGSENETDSDDDADSVTHRWSAVAAPDRRDGASSEGGDSELLADDKAPGTGERHLRDESQRRGHGCSSSSPSTDFSTVVVDVSPPAGRTLASSHPLEDDQRRSWWGASRTCSSSSSGSRGRSWWWPRFWCQHGIDGLSRWCTSREWSCACACASSLAHRCAFRSARSPSDKRGHVSAATGLRQPVPHNGSIDGGLSAFEMLRAAGAWLVYQLRRLLRDTEIMACAVIVAGLISFTYAFQLDMQASAETSDSKDRLAALAKAASAEVAAERHILADRPRGPASASLTGRYVVAADAAAAANLRDSRSIATGLAQAGAALPLPLSSPFASSPLSPLQSVAAEVSRLSTLWIVTLIGVAGVLASNALDCIIYVLEEVHCFHATAGPPRRSNRGAHRHERAAGETARPLADVQRGAVLLPHHTSHRQHSLSPCPPMLSSRTQAAVAASSTRPTVPAASATEPPVRIPASPQELLFMVNGIATFLYAGGLSASWLCSRFLLLLWSFMGSNAMSTAVEADGGVVGALTAAEARQLAACERPLAASRRTDNAALPVECTALMARRPQLQRLAALSTGPPWGASSAPPPPPPPSTEPFSLSLFFLLIALASVTSVMGTLCLLRILAEFTGVMAVIVTSVRKALTILLSFLLYGRRFTLLHGVGMVGVMGGVVWYELQRRRRCGV